MSLNEMDTHILPVRFEYHAPESLEEALDLLSKYGKEACPLAGGTDLLVKMKQRLAEPQHVVNIKGIGELAGIDEEERGVRIGSATRLREIERSAIVQKRVPILHEAVRSMASVQIRNMATVGGNLCNASPAADTAVALIALDAEANIAGQSSRRTVDLEEFFTGPGETVLGDDELLVGVLIPYPDMGSGSSFLKVGRTSLDIATVNAAAVVNAADGSIGDCRLVLGAVGPTPLRLRKVEAFIRGKEATPGVFEEAARMCRGEIRPITDVRASADYRRAASEALARYALLKAFGRAEAA